MEINRIVEKQRVYFATGATRDVDRRILELRRLRQAIRNHETQLCEAMKKDLGKSTSESYMCEVGLTLSELSYQIRHLKRWAKPRRRGTDLANFHGRSFSVREPYGCVLVMAPWNYPFLLCVEPMIGAIAAGNCCVLPGHIGCRQGTGAGGFSGGIRGCSRRRTGREQRPFGGAF